MVRTTSDLQFLTPIRHITVRYGDLTDRGSLLAAFRDAEVVFHVAALASDWGDWDVFRQVNVEGVRNVMECALASGVRRVVHVSSVSVYGFPGTTNLPEDAGFSARPEEPYITTKQDGERVAVGVDLQAPDDLHDVSLHEDDVAEALFLAATGRATGVFNVRGSGMATFREIGRLLHKKVLRLPYRVLRPLASLARVLRLSPVGGKTVAFISNPIITDTSRFARTFGFRPRFDTVAAVPEFDRRMH